MGRAWPLPTQALNPPAPALSALPQVRIGSRRQPNGAAGSLPHLEGVDVVSVDDALSGAGIVVLALPAAAQPQFTKDHG